MNESIDALTFEQALERLELVLRDLESNETGLDKSLERYEEGVRLLKRCRAVLDNAERKIRLLTGVDDKGNPISDEFAAGSDDRTPPAAAEPPMKPVRGSGRSGRRAAADGDGGKELF